MTKADIVTNIAIQTGLDKHTIATFVEAFTENIKSSLAQGENVYIRGFGSFITKKRAAKMARNISKEITIAVPEHMIPSFKPAKEFKAEIRNISLKK